MMRILFLLVLCSELISAEIHVFIHACRAGNWQAILGKQMRRIQESGLYDACNSISIGILGEEGDFSYFQKRYPKLQILFQDNDKTVFERPTIYRLHDCCVANPDAIVLYLHTKGVTRKGSIPVRDWTAYMEYFVIDRWRDCVAALTEEGHDACGVNWQGPPPHFSGNFWWATARYIATLPRHIGYNIPGAPQVDPEMWLGQNRPHIKCFHVSGVNHYYSPYPESMYKN